MLRLSMLSRSPSVSLFSLALWRSRSTLSGGAEAHSKKRPVWFVPHGPPGAFVFSRVAGADRRQRTIRQLGLPRSL